MVLVSRTALLAAVLVLASVLLFAGGAHAESYVTQSKGYFDAEFYRYCSRQTCTMGNLVADAYIAATGTLIGLAPATSYTGGFDSGIITDTLVNASLSNNYPLYTFDLPGTAVLATITHSVSFLSECEDNNNFLQVSGLLFDIDCSLTGSARVVSLRLDNGTAIKLDDTLYSVTTNAFLAGQMQNNNPLGYGASIVSNIRNLRNAFTTEQQAMLTKLVPGASIEPNTTMRARPRNCKFASNSSLCDSIAIGTRGSQFAYSSVECATRDCALARVLAKALFSVARTSTYFTRPLFALVPATSVRETLAPNTTALVYGDLKKSFRTEVIGYATMPGKQLRSVLETSVSYVQPGNSTTGCELSSRFLQSYNLRFTYDCSLPVGSRVSAIEIGDEQSGMFAPLDQSSMRRYALVAPLNLLRGGNRYKEFRNYADNIQPARESTLDAIEQLLTESAGTLSAVQGTAISVAPACNLQACNSTSFVADVGAAGRVVAGPMVLAVLLLVWCTMVDVVA